VNNIHVSCFIHVGLREEELRKILIYGHRFILLIPTSYRNLHFSFLKIAPRRGGFFRGSCLFLTNQIAHFSRQRWLRQNHRCYSRCPGTFFIFNYICKLNFVSHFQPLFLNIFVFYRT